MQHIVAIAVLSMPTVEASAVLALINVVAAEFRATAIACLLRVSGGRR